MTKGWLVVLGLWVAACSTESGLRARAAKVPGSARVPKVTTAAVLVTDISVDPSVAECVAGVIKNLEFPKPAGGGGVQVNYPFMFEE